MARPEVIETRDRYRVFTPVSTRWRDNDVFGHVNNGVYNSWIDTAVTAYFLTHWLCPADSPIIPVAVETKCTFRKPISHPASVETGLRVERIGTSSIKSGVGVFAEAEGDASAWGHMVHVLVDRTTNRPVPIPADIRSSLEAILVNVEGASL